LRSHVLLSGRICRDYGGSTRRTSGTHYGGGFFRCGRDFAREIRRAATKSARSRGRIRIELTTQMYGNSPRSQSPYTTAFDTSRCSATSASRSSRSRPPQSALRSASVAALLRARGVFWSPGPAPPTPPACAPQRAAVGPDSGRKRVEKSFGNPPKSCEPLDSPPPSVCKDCADLGSVSSPCDGSGPDSGPKGRRFKSSRPDSVNPRGSFPILPRRVEGAWAIRGLGSNRVANGAARRSTVPLAAGCGGSDTPPAA
jgi:hypothetical protein